MKPLLKASLFVLIAFASVLIIRYLLPENELLGTYFILGFALIYPVIANINGLTVLISTVLYSLVLIIDSQAEFWAITTPKTAESIVFPIGAGLFIGVFMCLGLLVKRLIYKRESPVAR